MGFLTSAFYGTKRENLTSLERNIRINVCRRIAKDLWNCIKEILKLLFSTGENNGERILEACSLDLPKFSLQFEADLKNSLRRLGLRDVFNRNDANLSPMTQNHVEGLYVSDALHKAVLTANEDGLEAGAATSIGISIRRAADVRVQINKPFLFAIRQDLTGAILFVGKVVRP